MVSVFSFSEKDFVLGGVLYRRYVERTVVCYSMLLHVLHTRKLLLLYVSCAVDASRILVLKIL